MSVICTGYRRLSQSENYRAEENPFAGQTLEAADDGDMTALHVLNTHLPDREMQRLPATLLETMAWALLVREEWDILVQPMGTAIKSEFNGIMENLSSSNMAEIFEGGFVAMMTGRAKERCGTGQNPHAVMASAVEKGLVVASFSKALLSSGRVVLPPEAPAWSMGNLKKKILETARKRLSIPQKIRGKEIIEGLRLIAGRVGREDENERKGVPLGARKTWDSPLPEVEIAAAPKDVQGRIPVLVAVHWLELGGAEKFAVDLIAKLPKETYAVYVTTDMPSCNSWAPAVREQVEEIFHIPEFLPPQMAQGFYVEYIRSRKIRLLHIHHAPVAYDSLHLIRRFFPELVVLDSLHIIELPPNSGGYPEAVGRYFTPFIDHHHVISRHLAGFLSQRWRVPDEKCSVVYLNVDTDYFDPGKVAKGSIRTRLGIPEDACLVGFIGRQVRQKRPHEFVDMAAAIMERLKREPAGEEVYFVMVGGGFLLSETRAKVEAMGISDRLLFHDEVIDTRPAYRDMDILVMPSENEGLALVTYEAMAMKLPVIFTDVGAQSELLPKEFLVPAAPPVAPRLAEAVFPLIGDPEKRERIGESFRQYILDHHRTTETFSAMTGLYARLLEEPGSASS